MPWQVEKVPKTSDEEKIELMGSIGLQVVNGLDYSKKESIKHV